MYSVVLGRVENILQGTEIPDDLGVDPELEEQVELGMNQHLSWRDEEGHRKIERLKKGFL